MSRTAAHGITFSSHDWWRAVYTTVRADTCTHTHTEHLLEWKGTNIRFVANMLSWFVVVCVMANPAILPRENLQRLALTCQRELELVTQREGGEKQNRNV